MKRALLLFAVGFAAAVCALGREASKDASAVTPENVIAAYRLKLKGDGWWRGASSAYRVGRVNGGAVLVLTKSDPDDGKIHAAIELDAKLAGTLLDLATPNPAAFVGAGFLVGDSLTLVDAGSTVDAAGPTFVSALNLQFQKAGAKLTGHWLTSYPPSSSDSGAGSGIGVEITGKRLQRKLRGAR